MNQFAVLLINGQHNHHELIKSGGELSALAATAMQ